MPKLKLLFILFIFLYLITPFFARAATLYLMPQFQTVYQGESFIVELRIDTEGEEINALKTDLEFPSSLLEVIDISKGGSVLNLWVVEPDFSNSVGLITLTGGRPMGFKGEGVIVKIIFRGKNVGQAPVNFKETSQVLLNDGKGTLAKLNFLKGNYEITAKSPDLPVITSQYHPDQNKWYRRDEVYFHWDKKEGASYSYLLSRDPLMEPDDIFDTPIGDIKYEGIGEGIFYFHLRERREGDPEFSPKTTFRIMIDRTPPEEFKIEIGKDPFVFEGKYFLSFATYDKMSGVDHYEILEADKGGFIEKIARTEIKEEWKVGESPYLLEDQTLRSKIKVKAIDKAGNERIAEYLPAKKPFPYWIIILVLIGAGVIWWIIKSRNRRRTLRETEAKL